MMQCSVLWVQALHTVNSRQILLKLKYYFGVEGKLSKCIEDFLFVQEERVVIKENILQKAGIIKYSSRTNLSRDSICTRRFDISMGSLIFSNGASIPLKSWAVSPFINDWTSHITHAIWPLTRQANWSFINNQKDIISSISQI